MKELNPPKVLKIGDYKNTLRHKTNSPGALPSGRNSGGGWSSHRSSRQECISRKSNMSHHTGFGATLSPGMPAMNTTVMGTNSKNGGTPLSIGMDQSILITAKQANISSYPHSRQDQFPPNNDTMYAHDTHPVTEDQGSSIAHNETKDEEDPSNVDTKSKTDAI